MSLEVYMFIRDVFFVCFLPVCVLDLSAICFVGIIVFDTLWVLFILFYELLMVPYFLVWILCCRLVVFLEGLSLLLLT